MRLSIGVIYTGEGLFAQKDEYSLNAKETKVHCPKKERKLKNKPLIVKMCRADQTSQLVRSLPEHDKAEGRLNQDSAHIR